MNSAVYLDQIVSSIMKNNADIKSVNNLEVVKMMDYTTGNHKRIKEFAQNGTIDKLTDPAGIEFEVNEGYDLIVVRFADDQDRRYLAVVYDSMDLWQDPEALEVIPLT